MTRMHAIICSAFLKYFILAVVSFGFLGVKSNYLDTLPVIGRLRRPVTLLLNVLVWGFIAYCSVRLFHLRVALQPFRIDSKISKHH